MPARVWQKASICVQSNRPIQPSESREKRHVAIATATRGGDAPRLRGFEEVPKSEHNRGLKMTEANSRQFAKSRSVLLQKSPMPQDVDRTKIQLDIYARRIICRMRLGI